MHLPHRFVGSRKQLTFKLHFYFKCMSLLPACMCVCHVCASCPRKPEEGVIFSGTGVTGICELPHGFWELSPGPLYSYALTSGPTLGLQMCTLEICCSSHPGICTGETSTSLSHTCVTNPVLSPESRHLDSMCDHETLNDYINVASRSGTPSDGDRLYCGFLSHWSLR